LKKLSFVELKLVKTERKMGSSYCTNKALTVVAPVRTLSVSGMDKRVVSKSRGDLYCSTSNLTLTSARSPATQKLMDQMFERQWNSGQSNASGQFVPVKNGVRVMHWNILADKLAYGDQAKDGFGCEAEGQKALLSWNDFRLPRILSEIERQNPDLICLVELDHYPDLIKALEPLGYEGTWMKKNRAFYADGTGLFWKTERFIKVKEVKQPFWKNKAEGKQADQIFVGVELKSNNADDFQSFLFTGCHLKSTKAEKGEKMRLDQAQQIMEIAKTEFPNLPMIMGADLNGESKENQTQAHAPQAHPYLLDAGLTSAYKDGLGHEPRFTSWKKRVSPQKTDDDGNIKPSKVAEFKYAIDFIFKSAAIKTIRVLAFPNESQFSKDDLKILLPNRKCPSDHLPLVSDLLLPSAQ